MDIKFMGKWCIIYIILTAIPLVLYFFQIGFFHDLVPCGEFETGIPSIIFVIALVILAILASFITIPLHFEIYGMLSGLLLHNWQVGLIIFFISYTLYLTIDLLFFRGDSGSSESHEE
ncbi:hypothetical protein ACFLZN_01635 [Nanoarchaeota archaeon]